jgi:hypothetical protein
VRGPGQTASFRSARVPRAPCSEADDCAAWSRRLSSTRPLCVEDSWEDPKASPVRAATHPRLRPSAPTYVDAVVATPTPSRRIRSPRFPHNQAVLGSMELRGFEPLTSWSRCQGRCAPLTAPHRGCLNSSPSIQACLDRTHKYRPSPTTRCSCGAGHSGPHPKSMELRGFEPLTSWVRSRRSPN